MLLQIESPMPMPPGLVVTKGWNRRSATSAGRHRTCVDHVNLDCAGVFGRSAGAQGQRASVDAVQGVDAVAHQVDHDLLDLHPVDHHLRQVGSEVEGGRHRALTAADHREFRRLADDGIDRLPPVLGFRLW